MAYRKEGKGHQKVNFKLRDWVFSRQRYWGEPIPIVKCDDCGYVPLPESELPLSFLWWIHMNLPIHGESPLAKMTDWVNTTCPYCGNLLKGNRYNAAMGRLILVFLKIYGPAQ